MPASNSVGNRFRTLADLDSFVDESVDSMCESDLADLQKKTRKIMADAESRADASDALHETMR